MFGNREDHPPQNQARDTYQSILFQTDRLGKRLMCGIAGMIGFNELRIEQQVIERMTSSLLHRGPDDGAIYMAGSVGLGFRRLAILDLSMAAHQPMISDDGQVVLVFNGEIFNYQELRLELQALGHSFRSTGDTEVLLRAYREWGPECLHKLNGMWAFVIYDQTRNLIFGSRDRFGIKPLYYYRTENYFLFGSEIKAILSSGFYRNTPNINVIAEFLLQERLDETENTFYEGIDQVPPGSAFELHLNGRFEAWRYWFLHDCPGAGSEDPIRLFADLFEDSVRLHIRSDVPVGVCLSGGLDSTSIICALARYRQEIGTGTAQPLLAFSYNAPEFDESAYVQDTISQTRAQLARLQTEPLWLWNSLGRVLSFQDEPVHTMTALVGFELMGLAAANGVRVVLNGQGADETLAGYPSYFRDYWYTLLKHGDLKGLWREIGCHSRVHGGCQTTTFIDVVRHLVQGVLWQTEPYRRLARWKHHRVASRHSWFNSELDAYLPADSRDNKAVTLDGSLRWSIEHAPLPLYLRVEDRNSMAHSVEARLPFLDYRLVSLVFSMASKWKMRGPWNKYVLREAMRERIPESVRSRVDKMGFPVPAKNWVSGALYTELRDLLSSQKLRDRGFYKLDAIQRDLELHRQNRIDISRKLFNIVQLEKWYDLQNSPGRNSADSNHLGQNS